jgi:NADPH:quinone reductase-like Zn-dependent oxidoreductase
MKAAVYRRYGPPDVVQIAELPRPDLAPKDVLVKVRATTVTAGDSRLRSANLPRGFGIMVRLGFGIFGPRKPILGSELAGEVAAVGQSVSRFAPGDKVFAARIGCHAEYVAVPEDRVAPMPGNLTFGEAAALTFGGLTALFYTTRQGPDSAARTGTDQWSIRRSGFGSRTAGEALRGGGDRGLQCG